MRLRKREREKERGEGETKAVKEVEEGVNDAVPNAADDGDDDCWLVTMLLTNLRRCFL